MVSFDNSHTTDHINSNSTHKSSVISQLCKYWWAKQIAKSPKLSDIVIHSLAVR